MEIHAVSMPHPRSPTKSQWYWEIHVNPGKAESYQRHSSVTKGYKDQLGVGQTEVEIHATAMPRPEGVTPRASGTRGAIQNYTSGTMY